MKSLVRPEFTTIFFIHNAQSLPGFNYTMAEPSCVHIAHVGNLFKTRLASKEADLMCVPVTCVGLVRGGKYHFAVSSDTTRTSGICPKHGWHTMWLILLTCRMSHMI